MLIRVFNFGFECAAWFHFYRNLRHRLHMCVNFGDDLRLDIYFSSYKGKSPQGPCQGPKKSIFWPFFGPSDHNTCYKILCILLNKLQVHLDQIDIFLGWYLLPILKNQHLKNTILANFALISWKLWFSETKFSKYGSPMHIYPIWCVIPSRITISQNIKYSDISHDLNGGQ